MRFEIRHNTDRNRFETGVDGHECVLDYTLENGAIAMNRVYVPRPVEGRGIAGALTRHALEYSRKQGLKVIPNCPYVAAWIERHIDYQDLVADADN